MIRVESLVKSFRRNRVLDGLDLEIVAGERVALVGSNGAGKTTLIRCLLGEYGAEGRVTIDGLSPRERRTEILQSVGFVPQLPPALRMPVGELLGFAATLCGSDPARMEAVAMELGLEVGPIRGQSFAKLSGGQKQKLLIAVALGREVRLLIMDEPAANLDPEARLAFFLLLARCGGGVTMLISSHRLDEVASLVNRVVELDRGRVVLDDRVADFGSVGSVLRCRIRLARREEAVAATLASWGILPAGDGLDFEGPVAGPDRLRFFGMLARYSGLVASVSLDRADHGREC
ncbi:MAG: ABC transporter ATP-binding protein [Myxococcota bacterium]